MSMILELVVMVCIGLLSFGGGLWLGLTHNTEINAELDIVKHNALVAAITAWIRDNKPKFLDNMMARGGEPAQLPETIASEVEKAHTKKTLK